MHLHAVEVQVDMYEGMVDSANVRFVLRARSILVTTATTGRNNRIQSVRSHRQATGTRKKQRLAAATPDEETKRIAKHVATELYNGDFVVKRIVPGQP